ncbi:diaminopropionate ammonia-lyase [Donghicola tyrosinivorans]|uniref:Diaminopropionate ammonia-lyase n=2 Tax=Donghicola tyrosinivorans TaxID=1652492 RepID=A0A2T0W8R6_9RHOB|nr:diaminopropionate ammonia-lyase [Donghicola tyrosinivorans]
MNYFFNEMPQYQSTLAPQDAAVLSIEGAAEVRRILDLRDHSQPTPMHHLPALAAQLGVADIHIKDEGHRLGLGSFKALGGAYALMRLVQAEASKRLGRCVPAQDLLTSEVRAIAEQMTFACATDGNHGRSVAQGAQIMGARAVILVHSGVSDARIQAIANFGADIIRVKGNYDDSVTEASRVSAEKGWTVLSDTSWPGYEDIPGLVMQGYTAIVQEALQQLSDRPTHVFLQAGVGGFAAAIAGHFAVIEGEHRPNVTVVEPDRAACLMDSARAGQPVRTAETEPTIMAMLECYEPSLTAFRVLSRVADGFMTVGEQTAPAVMRLLANPQGDDPAIVAGESGAVGLAGAMAVLGNPELSAKIGLGASSRLLFINTEGATDPALYQQIVGRSPAEVAAQTGGDSK